MSSMVEEDPMVMRHRENFSREAMKEYSSMAALDLGLGLDFSWMMEASKGVEVGQ